MIMKARTFMYNAEITIFINLLNSLKPNPTPVPYRFATCRGPVYIFIHRLIHSFCPSSRQGSQQVHIILADTSLGLT